MRARRRRANASRASDGAIDRAVAQHLGTETGGDRVADLGRLVELVHHRVGRQRRRAESLQGVERRRLAGADAARQPDEGDHAPLLARGLR